MKKIFFLLLCTQVLCAKEVDESNVVQEKKGNLALRPSQQPSPLFCFGQLIVDQYTLQPQLDVNSPEITRKKNDQLIFALLYGITDYASVYLTIPYATKISSDGQQSSGIQDIFAQFEFLLKSTSDHTSTAQTTLVVAPSFPTGSSKKNPPTGNGSLSLFLGSTHSYMSTDWYYFVSGGYLINSTNRSKKKMGNQLVYQAGGGRNVGNPSGSIMTWFFEFHGTYEEHSTQNNYNIPNTGGNIIYLGPTLWFSTKRFFLEIGLAFPIIQTLNGKQPKTEYLAGIDMGWTLH